MRLKVTGTFTVDVAGGPMGGAARFRDELYRYLSRSPCPDVAVIGMERRVDPAWLVQREMVASRRGRRVALNNVGFIVPGGERWTLLGNALHFLTEAEASLSRAVLALDSYPAGNSSSARSPPVRRSHCTVLSDGRARR